jgi:transaldolase/glucose-6-phosphate isomerase
MSADAESTPGLWLAGLTRADLTAERLGSWAGPGRIEGVLIEWGSAAGEGDRRAAVRSLAQAGWSAQQMSDALMASDNRSAAGLLLASHERSNGRKGFVAARFPSGAAAGSYRQRAEELTQLVNRPNLVIGFPHTSAGLEAAESLLKDCQPVLIGPVVSFDGLGLALEACTRGLRGRTRTGSSDLPLCLVVFDPARVVAQVETLLAALAAGTGRRSERAAALAGRTGNVLLQLALAQVGAAQADVGDLGSIGLIALSAWGEVGLEDGDPTSGTGAQIGIRLAGGEGTAEGMARLGLSDDWAMISSSRAHLEGLTSLGISVDELGSQASADALKSDEASTTRDHHAMEALARQARAELGELAPELPAALAGWEADHVGRRMWSGDVSLWTDKPSEADEASRRLGWLTLPEVMQAEIGALKAFAEELRSEGLRHAVVLGMGGSSLAPDVFRRVLHPAHGMELHVLDSTDPEMVERIASAVSPGEALYIVSSKSGTTTEPLALLEYFWAATQAAVGDDAGRHFAAVTDPGTSLQTLAEARGFRRVFSAPADVGGRYSALSVFGLLPAALLGADIGAMLTGAADMARRCGPGVEAARNPGLHLGATLALAAERGRNKLTFLVDEGLEPLEDWIEQLIAESSGKQGKGILPVTGEPSGAVESYGRDRLFAYLRTTGAQDELIAGLTRAGHPVVVIDVDPGERGLGEEFFRWEFATAAACHRLGVNAFDQPDVQRAKDRTSELLKTYRKQGSIPTPAVLWQAQGIVLEGREGSLPGPKPADLASAHSAVLSLLHDGEALCFLVYLPADAAMQADLLRLRTAVRDRRRAASSHGFGPRYLHSTGQLHKGGPDDMVFIVLTADRGVGVAVPGMGVTFNLLQRAQAIGDLQSLLSIGRRAFGFHLDSTARLPDWFASFHAALADSSDA